MNKSNSIKHYLSRIFQPITIIPKDANINKQEMTSKSQRLMLELGIIQQFNPGCFHLLPLGLKALNKLTKLIDSEMEKINGQKVIFPTLVNKSLWKVSGRIDNASSELFHLKDRHNHSYILCPTHEETVSDLLGSMAPISYKNFPLRLYQITSKFRDEMKPRFGLMRGREFIMKDMYSFDTNIENAKKTYEDVCNCYDRIFDEIGVDFVKVLGTSGNMGGNLSHEYHFKAEIGEDKILSCKNCNYSANVELSGDKSCPQCKRNDCIEITSGIEVGHTFFLGDKYSKPLKAKYLASNAKPTVLQMGSYGLGITRILGAAVEVLSEEQEMRWPDALAPFNVIILPPKSGSKEEGLTQNYAEKLYQNIEKLENFKDNVLIDDRTSLTIGRRYVDAKRVGYRFIIAIGQKATENTPLFELNDLKNDCKVYLTEHDLLNYIKNNSELVVKYAYAN